MQVDYSGYGGCGRRLVIKVSVFARDEGDGHEQSVTAKDAKDEVPLIIFPQIVPLRGPSGFDERRRANLSFDRQSFFSFSVAILTGAHSTVAARIKTCKASLSYLLTL